MKKAPRSSWCRNCGTRITYNDDFRLWEHSHGSYNCHQADASNNYTASGDAEPSHDVQCDLDDDCSCVDAIAEHVSRELTRRLLG